MVDQVFETYRKASASFMQMQQDLFKQWAQQWPSASMEGAGTSSEWYQRIQKRWRDFATDSLNMHRESLDSMYKAAIDLYRESLKIYPGYVAGYRGLGLAYEEAGRKDDALIAFHTYVRTVPNAVDAAIIRRRIEHLETAK